MSTITRRSGPDLLRVLCFLAVVTIHVSSVGAFKDNSTAFVFDQVARFAVPCFFMLSGYFWHPGELFLYPRRVIWRSICRILPPFVLWLVLYLLAGWSGLLGSHYVDISLARAVTSLWTGGAGYHLWFLPALVVGTLMVATLARAGTVALFVSVTCLYFLGLALGSYSEILLGRALPLPVFRNGIFYAPFFLAIGALIRQNESAILKRINTVKLAFLAVFFGFMHVLEGLFIVRSFPTGHEYSITTIGYSAAVFLLFLSVDVHAKWTIRLGEGVFGAYLIHLGLLFVAIHLFPDINPYALILFTATASLTFSVFIRRVLSDSAILRYVL